MKTLQHEIDMTDRYIELLLEFPPRPIRSKEQLEATQAVVDRLIDSNPSEVEREYMSVLGTLIKEYEDASIGDLAEA